MGILQSVKVGQDGSMEKISLEPAEPLHGDAQSHHDRLVALKALSKKLLDCKRAAWRANYEVLSDEDKALVEKEIREIASKIAAQFCRSRLINLEV